MGELLTGSFGPKMERAPHGLRIRGPADPFIQVMRATKSKRDRLVLAVRALRKDPDCVEARVEVAAHCEDARMRVHHLWTAIQAGARFWEAPGIRCIAQDFGSEPGALPWLTAHRDLGRVFEEVGDTEAARSAYERLLEIDPSDQLGAQARLDSLGSVLSFNF